MTLGLGAVAKLANSVLDRVIPDQAQRDAAKLALAQLEQSGDLAELAAETDLLKGQLAVNLEEAKSDSILVSGWRPFMGWCCSVIVLLYGLVGIAAWGLLACGRAVPLPEINIGFYGPLITALLGMRTFEKWQGITSKATGH